MNVDITTILLALTVGVGLFIVVLFATSRSRLDLSSRLANFEDEAHVTSVREAELTQPLMQRVILPSINRIGEAISKRLGTTELGKIDRQLNSVGWTGITASGFLSLRVVLGIIALALGSGLVVFLAMDMPLSVVIPVAMGAGGFILPKARLDSTINRRKRAILRSLPAALDLLTICVQGGLSFDAALQEVASKYHNALSVELNIMLNEVRLGRARRDAMRALEQRVEVPELTNFVDAILQSEHLGSSISDALTIQSEEIRRRRRQRAEELGQKAPIKMLLPLVGCIFPTIFVILLGPAALTIIRQVMGIPQ